VARRDRARQREVATLSGRADAERAAGRLQPALDLQARALAIADELASEHPGDPQYTRAIAGEKYKLGAMQTAAGQHQQAVETLESARQHYESIAGQPRMPDTAPLIADVEIRRALALAAWGRGASAVPAAAAAVQASTAASDAGPAARQQDLPRLLADNAKILFRYGDPDMAVASADQALRLYLSGTAGRAQFAINQGSVPYLVTAAAVAALVHARFGRMDTGLTPAALALDWTGQSQLRARLHEVGTRMTGSSDYRRQVQVEVLAGLREDSIPAGLQGGRLQVSDGARQLLTILTALDRTASERLPPPASPADRGVTLTGALRRAGLDELGAGITRPAMDVAILTPYDRAQSDAAAMHGLRLAEAALPLFRPEPSDALRIALEAHYLYAAASQPQAMTMRREFAAVGPAWARALLASAELVTRRGETQFALDLSAWAAGVARQLTPFAVVDADLRALTRRCVEQHGHALVAAGDRAAGEAALAEAATMWQGQP
jgi:hypothetical protein